MAVRQPARIPSSPCRNRSCVDRSLSRVADFRAWWTDGRLAYDGSCGVPQLKFSSAAQLWVPDFYFEKPQSVTLGGGSRGELLSVQPDGSIFWSRQAEVSLSCPMHFGNLPFDTHECPYKLGLYSQVGM